MRLSTLFFSFINKQKSDFMTNLTSVVDQSLGVIPTEQFKAVPCFLGFAGQGKERTEWKFRKLRVSPQIRHIIF